MPPLHAVAVAALAGALLAVPAQAGARASCDYVGTGALTVYTAGGVTPDSIAGVCIDLGDGAGGYLEAGTGTPGTYVIWDGHDGNPGSTAGYVGVSDYETSPTGAVPCAVFGGPPRAGDGTNSGGCLYIRSGTSSGSPVLIGIPFVPLACGNADGPDWLAAGGDGCTIP